MPYTVKFSMPIIGAAANYAGITPRTTVTVNPNQGVTIVITPSGSPNPAEARLFATMGGLLTYRPIGASLPNGTTATTPTLLLESNIMDLRAIATEMASGAPQPGFIMYENIDPASLAASFTAIATAQPLSVLEAAWPTPPATGIPRSTLQTSFETALNAGTHSVFIEGGTDIGAAGAGPTTGSYKIIYSFLETLNPPAVPVHLSVLPYFSSMAPVANETLTGSATWNNHPLITATANAAIPLDVYVRFVAFNPNTNTYDPLRSGIAVELWDYDSISDDDLVTMIDPATSLPPVTNAQGLIHGQVADVRSLNLDDFGSLPDLFFKAKVAGTVLPWYSLGDTNPEHQFPRDWSTKGWYTVDGKSPGYYENFEGSTLGTAANPLVFAIGVDFYLRFSFEDRDSIVHNVPKGAYMEVRKDNPVFGETVLATLRTEIGGYVEGVVFDVDSEDEISFRLLAKMEDASINLKMANFGMVGSSSEYQYWDTKEIEGVGSIGIHPSSAGPGKPARITIKADNGSNLLYVMKIAREFAIFMYNITKDPANPSNIGWPGTEVTYEYLGWSIVTGMAFPVGTVFLGPDRVWDRETIFHETAHQVMWKMLGVQSSDMIDWFTSGKIALKHWERLKHSNIQSLMEGWASFFQTFIAGECHNVEMVELSNGDFIPLGPTLSVGTVAEVNQGHLVEGSFANALRTVLQERVNTQKNSLGQTPIKFKLEESSDGELLGPTLKNDWITDSTVRQVFKDLIWEPFKTLTIFAHSERGSTHMADAMLTAASPSLTHQVRGWMNAYNMAVKTITASAPSITSGPAAGGDPFTVTGTDFVIENRPLDVPGAPRGRMEVTFGGVRVRDISVTNSTTLTGKTPASPAGVGLVDVEVRLVVRGVIVKRILHPGAFEYK